jgi:hypothetical protein
LLANIILNQYRGSEVSDETMPYNGIWLITKNINSVNPVHISFWLNGTLVSGCCTSGRIGEKGLMRSRNRTKQSRSVSHVFHQLLCGAAQLELELRSRRNWTGLYLRPLILAMLSLNTSQTWKREEDCCERTTMKQHDSALNVADGCARCVKKRNGI